MKNNQLLQRIQYLSKEKNLFFDDDSKRIIVLTKPFGILAYFSYPPSHHYDGEENE